MSTIEDELTGLHTRRSFLALLRRHVGFANDRQTNLALIVADIDGFARLNAAHGYDFGDQRSCAPSPARRITPRASATTASP